MGIGAWVIARAKGEKKPLSIGCMSGQCEHEEHQQRPMTEQTKLQEQVGRLQLEVETLRRQVNPSGEAGGPSDAFVGSASKE